MQKRKVLKSEYVPRANSLKVTRVTLQKQKEKRVKIIFFFLFFVMVFSLVLFLLLSPRFFIRSLKVETKDSLFQKKAELAVHEYMEGKVLHLFPHKNIFIFSEDSLEKRLRDAFSKVKNVETTKELTFKTVSLETRDPLYKVISRSGQTFYLSDEAILYTDNEEARTFLTIVEESGSVSTLQATSSFGDISFQNTLKSDFLFDFDSLEGQKVPEDFFRKINFYRDKFRSAGLPVSSIKIREEGTVSFMQKSGEIRVDVKEEEEGVWGRLSAALLNEKFKEKIIENASSLEYIDLRFGSKIFYKFKTAGTSTQEIAEKKDSTIPPASLAQ